MKTGKNTTIVAYFILLANLCLYNKAFSNTILSIKVEGISINAIKITCLEDVLLERTWQKNLDLSISKNYDLDIELNSPKLFQITFNNNTYDLYLEPNDSLILKIKAKYFPHQLSISGIGQERNALLYNFFEKFEQETQKKTLEKMYSCKSATEYRKYIDDELAKKWKFYHQIYSVFKSKMTPSFERFMNVKLNLARQRTHTTCR
jgi:hypothetical protein